MEETKKDRRLIKDFFKEKLSKDDKHEFLQKASSDRDFVKDFVNELEKEAGAQEFSDNEDDESSDESNISHSGRRGIIFVSSIAAGLAIGIFVLQSIFFPTNRQLYKHNYQPISAANYITRGQANSDASDFQKGVSLYYEGKYKAAYDQLCHLFTEQTPAQEIILFSGLSLMGMEDYYKAIEVFELADDRVISTMPEIPWYLGLSYIKIGEREKANNSLKNLPGEEGQMGKMAGKLLKKLR